MKKFLAVLVLFVFGGLASANPPVPKPPPHVKPVAPVHKARHVDFKNYHVKHGTTFAHNGRKLFLYKGWNHYHWKKHFWNNNYGCYLYLDESLGLYYYWCHKATCYYPVSYAPFGYVFNIVMTDNGPVDAPIPDPVTDPSQPDQPE